MARARRKRATAARRRAGRVAPAKSTRTSTVSRTLAEAQLARVRELVGSFGGVTEKISHGFPTFWVAKRCFAYFLDNHHRDGRLALWCMAPAGAQAMLVDAEPEHYFVPPYVGHLGWVGVRLDTGHEWSQIAAVLEGAYAVRTALTRGRAAPRSPRDAPRAR